MMGTYSGPLFGIAQFGVEGVGGDGGVPSQKGLHARGSAQSKRTACKGKYPVIKDKMEIVMTTMFPLIRENWVTC
jgi:hypothetical protein